MARPAQTAADRAASTWKIYQSAPLALLLGSVLTLALGGVGVGTEPGRLRRAFAAHILVGLVSAFSSVGFYFRARNGFESARKRRPARTQTPVKTLVGLAALAVLWMALLALLAVAWRREVGDGAVVRVGSVAASLAVDAVMVLAWVLAGFVLLAALRVARAADDEDGGATRF